jgi:conjugal transfer pilus assembly protein TraW
VRRPIALLRLLAVAALSSLGHTSFAAVRPVLGALYPIEEPDALSEIEDRAAKVDWAKHLGPAAVAARVRAYRPPNLEKLPRARADRDRFVDMSYTNERDIPDGKGGILYPKGFRFNPLDYLTVSSVFAVLDGNDPRQIQWLKRQPWFDDPRLKILLTDGDHTATAEAVGRHVYYLTTPVAQRMQLVAVPSLVNQEGHRLRVREFSLEEPPHGPSR